MTNRHFYHRSSWKKSSLAEPRASRGTHRANPASGPIPHKPYPRGPLQIRACVVEPNPDPKQVHTGPAREQVLLLPSLCAYGHTAALFFGGAFDGGVYMSKWNMLLTLDLLPK
ncbi:hypothetical protein DY000_02035657 [Brassica cretica]|uniref:Uncharacterized protein n=1 Tax=Brassica cretica TaxID=69181 RepID=A0ABQ7DK03_BRACR|nr:hypothetical protein DY000_02035657 [Brassica cretica]